MKRHRLLGDLRSGRLAGADGPDGLVGDRHPLGVLQTAAAPARRRVVATSTSSVLPCFALGLGLAHAHDGQQAVIESGVHLLLHVRVGLAEELPPLGMADDDGGHAEVGQHGRGDLPGVRPLVLPEHVLRRDLDVAWTPAARTASASPVKGGATTMSRSSRPLHAGGQFGDEGRPLGAGLVHLPVARDERDARAG